MTSDDRAQLIDVLARRFGETLEVDAQLQGSDALLRIASHCSHRRWRQQPVPKTLVRLLAACAMSAPSKSDLQQASIIDVRAPEQRQAIAALVPQFPWLQDAPAFLVFCADGRKLRALFARHGTPFVNEHLDQFFNAVVDGSLVMMNFMQAASARGLVYCPISMIRNHPAQLDAILSLPSHVVPIAGLCLGFPEQEGRIVPRLPLTLTVHQDRYSSNNLDVELDAYDARRHAMEARNSNDSAWSAAKREQYATVQRSDWGAYIRSKGFGLT